MGLDEHILRGLYAAPPAQFVALRDAAAKTLKQAGRLEDAAAVKLLKRPGAALWAVNQLGPGDPALMQAWLAVTARMRRAQTAALGPGGAAELRDAGTEQRSVLTALMAQAERVLTEGAACSTTNVARVRDLLLATVTATEEVCAGLKCGMLTQEPTAADVGDMLLGMEPGAPSALPARVEPMPPGDNPQHLQAQQQARLEVEWDAAQKRVTEITQQLDDARAMARQLEAQAQAALATVAARSAELATAQDQLAALGAQRTALG